MLRLWNRVGCCVKFDLRPHRRGLSLGTMTGVLGTLDISNVTLCLLLVWIVNFCYCFDVLIFDRL